MRCVIPSLRTWGAVVLTQAIDTPGMRSLGLSCRRSDQSRGSNVSAVGCGTLGAGAQPCASMATAGPGGWNGHIGRTGAMATSVRGRLRCEPAASLFRGEPEAARELLAVVPSYQRIPPSCPGEEPRHSQDAKEAQKPGSPRLPGSDRVRPAEAAIEWTPSLAIKGLVGKDLRPLSAVDNGRQAERETRLELATSSLGS